MGISKIHCQLAAFAILFIPFNIGIPHNKHNFCACINRFQFFGVCPWLIRIVLNDKYANTVSFALLIHRDEACVEVQLWPGRAWRVTYSSLWPQAVPRKIAILIGTTCTDYLCRLIQGRLISLIFFCPRSSQFPKMVCLGNCLSTFCGHKCLLYVPDISNGSRDCIQTLYKQLVLTFRKAVACWRKMGKLRKMFFTAFNSIYHKCCPHSASELRAVETSCSATHPPWTESHFYSAKNSSVLVNHCRNYCPSRIEQSISIHYLFTLARSRAACVRFQLSNNDICNDQSGDTV